MSVLIKGMKMPKDCEHCRFCGIDVESGCWIKKNWVIRKVGESRPSWCLLVDVPTPHGRLIDADALTGEQYKEGNLMVVEMDAIEDAPTVIEAED